MSEQNFTPSKENTMLCFKEAESFGAHEKQNKQKLQDPKQNRDNF